MERYTLLRPDDVRGRLELARAYYYAGDDVAARREFEAVRALDPPPAVRTGIDRYLEASGREAQYRPSVRGIRRGRRGIRQQHQCGVAQANIAFPCWGR